MIKLQSEMSKDIIWHIKQQPETKLFFSNIF